MKWASTPVASQEHNIPHDENYLFPSGLSRSCPHFLPTIAIPTVRLRFLLLGIFWAEKWYFLSSLLLLCSLLWNVNTPKKYLTKSDLTDVMMKWREETWHWIPNVSRCIIYGLLPQFNNTLYYFERTCTPLRYRCYASVRRRKGWEYRRMTWTWAGSWENVNWNLIVDCIEWAA